MPKAAKSKPPPSPPESSEEMPEDLSEEETSEGEVETGGNGHTETEEPAKMKVSIEGTARAVATAAKRVSGGTQPPPRPEKEESDEPPADPLAPLLADPKNMVVVTRKFPRVFHLRNGDKVRCAVKVDKYACPMRREQIEEDVFDRFGGQSYNVTIHPNTTIGENTILGAFEIEHPNPEAPPYIDDPEGDAQEAAEAMGRSIPGGTDPTLRETDPLAAAKISLERRLDRARMKKEIKDLERMVKEVEGDDDEKKPPALPSGPDPRDKEIADLKAALVEKKVDDRFSAMQNSIADLTRTVQSFANRPPVEHKSGGGEDSLVLKILTQSQSHSKEMLDLVKTMNKPAAQTADASENFDKMLDRFAKMKTAFGDGDSRVSKLQDQLLEMAMERVLGGGEEGGDEEDTMKFAIKQFTPVLKTYVEKQVEKEEKTDKDGKKQEVSKERMKEIYQEAAGKAAKDLEEKWRKEGWLVRDPKIQGGGQKPGLPAPQKKPQIPQKGGSPGKVVARKETSEGIVEHIQIEPADLSQKTTPRGDAATAEAKHEEAEEVQYTDMPGIGKVEIPPKPGEMRYDRKKAVNYVLNSILSEIAEGTPQKAANDSKIESYIPADALEFLDNELLAEIHKATSGGELEGTLGKWGDREKLDKIKEAGKDEIVDSWVRRAIRTTQDIWRDQQNQ